MFYAKAGLILALASCLLHSQVSGNPISIIGDKDDSVINTGIFSSIFRTTNGFVGDTWKSIDKATHTMTDIIGDTVDNLGSGLRNTLGGVTGMLGGKRAADTPKDKPDPAKKAAEPAPAAEKPAPDAEKPAPAAEKPAAAAEKPAAAA